MLQYPSSLSLARVGLTLRDFLAQYVECQHRKPCETRERFIERVVTQFYLDFPEIAPEIATESAQELTHAL